MQADHARRVHAAAFSLEAATAAFIAYLNQFPDPTASQPLPGGWSPAGHAAHLALTNDVFLSVLHGGPGCTGPIKPFEGVSDFSDGRWNLDAPPRGVAAPSILLPPPDVGRTAAIARLRESVSGLTAAILALDPPLALLCVRLPWAVVSVYQMAEWGGGHTVRHLNQVSRELQIAAMNGAPAAA